MVEHTNPEKWSCDMCVYYYPWDEERKGRKNRYHSGVLGECRYVPQTKYVYDSDYWCGKFELNRTHPKAGFSELYKNEYSQEQKIFKYMLQSHTGEDE